MTVLGEAPATHTTSTQAPSTQATSKQGTLLIDHFERGLDAPICLTWELTYACNLSCVHCLSSSGRRDPRELTTAQAEAVIDELERMQVFYVNIGGGEPTVRRDFWELVEYATEHHVGVKFSTNGTFINATAAARLASMDYLDVQISLDGIDAATNDRVRGDGSYDDGDSHHRRYAEARRRSTRASGSRFGVGATRNAVSRSASSWMVAASSCRAASSSRWG